MARKVAKLLRKGVAASGELIKSHAVAMDIPVARGW